MAGTHVLTRQPPLRKETNAEELEALDPFYGVERTLFTVGLDPKPMAWFYS